MNGLRTYIRARHLRKFSSQLNDYALKSFGSHTIRQRTNVETCAITYASFLPVCHQLYESCLKKLSFLGLRLQKIYNYFCIARYAECCLL